MDIAQAIEYYRNKPENRSLSISKLAEQIIISNNGNFHGHTNFDTLRRIIPKYLKNKTSKPIDLNEDFSIDIPDGFFEDRTPYVLAPIYNNALVLNDIHIPYHNREALILALKYGYEHKVNAIILNGDTIDCLV